MNKQEYKIKLEKEKKELLEELSSLGKVDETGDWEATPDSSNNQEVQDEADMAERNEDYENRTAILSHLEERLSDIENALNKISMDNEIYGTCEVCEKKIEEDRLEVNPSARTCKSCMNN